MSFVSDYNQAADIILSQGGTVSIQGPRGTGKTQLCRQLIDAAVRRGISAAYIDAELSRGICGPPGTVSLAYVTEETEEYTGSASYFVGDIVPAGHMASYIAAVQQAVFRAKEAGTQLIVIDSCGKTDYSPIFPAKQNEIDILRPDFVIVLQRAKEAEFIIIPFLNRRDIMCTVKNADYAPKYSPVIARTAFRSEMFRYLKGAKEHIIPFSQVSFLNTWLACGRSLKWQYLKSLSEMLETPVVHGEQAGRTLILFTDAEISEENRQRISSMLKINRIQTISPGSFSNLYIGLEDENSRLLSVGTIISVDYENRRLTVSSPILTAGPVKNIRFGFFGYS